MILISILFIIFFLGIWYVSQYFFFWLGQRIFNKKVGKVLSVLITLIFITPFYLEFRHQLLFKNDVIEILEEHKINLKEDFEIVNHQSVFMDPYKTFTIAISATDEASIMKGIKLSKPILTDTLPDDNIQNDLNQRYFGKTITRNYNLNGRYIQTYFKPSGEKGYAPTYHVISIFEGSNLLTFENH